MKPSEISFTPVDNHRLANLCGALDENLRQIETALDVGITRRGEHFALTGAVDRTRIAAKVLRDFYDKAADPLSLDAIQLALIEAGQIDILFANHVELGALTGHDDFHAGIEALKDKVPLLVVTRSEHGAVAATGGVVRMTIARAPAQAEQLHRRAADAQHGVTAGLGGEEGVGLDAEEQEQRHQGVGHQRHRCQRQGDETRHDHRTGERQCKLDEQAPGAAGREGNLHVMACLLRCGLDGCNTAENHVIKADQVARREQGDEALVEGALRLHDTHHRGMVAAGKTSN